MVVSNRNLLFQGSIFRCYVGFREGNPDGWSNLKSVTQRNLHLHGPSSTSTLWTSLCEHFYQSRLHKNDRTLSSPNTSKGHQSSRLKERGANLFLDLIRIWEHSTCPPRLYCCNGNPWIFEVHQSEFKIIFWICMVGISFQNKNFGGRCCHLDSVTGIYPDSPFYKRK